MAMGVMAAVTSAGNKDETQVQGASVDHQPTFSSADRFRMAGVMTAARGKELEPLPTPLP